MIQHATQEDQGVTFTAWREELAGGFGPSQQARIPLSDSTHKLRIFETNMVPGLLQTRAWALTTLANNPGLPDEAQPTDLETGVDARLARQHILTEPGRDIHILMRPDALRTWRKPPATLDEQLTRLLAATDDAHYRFGVVPDFIDVRWVPAFQFWIYDDDLVQLETHAGQLELTHPSDVEAHLKVFAALAEVAVYDQAARDLLIATAELLPR